MTNVTVDSRIDEAIQASRAGDKARALELLVQVLQADQRSETAWLWMSASVTTRGEQRFCLERVLELNPNNAAAQRGLQSIGDQYGAIMPHALRPKPAAAPVAAEPAPAAPPAPQAQPAEQVVARCSHPGCNAAVSNPNHTLCREHWKEAQQAKQQTKQPAKQQQQQSAESSMLTASAIGEKLGIPSWQVNHMFAEFGWLESEKSGWKPTEQGLALGAVQRIHYASRKPYAVWPETIVEHKLVLSSQENSSEQVDTTAAAAASFRDRSDAKFRTTDGHMVRSKAEMLIDNWLYMSGIVHAYERQLPIEEVVYCDFYIPRGKIYIEYWGLENDPNYQERRAKKLELYQRSNFNLIQLTDEHVRNLDDVLPKLLLKYGLNVD